MKAQIYPPQIRDFACLIAELEDGYTIRNDGTRNVSFSLDANVLWFFMDQSERENSKLDGYFARKFGKDQVAGLIRRTLEARSHSSAPLFVAESHRSEAEVAFHSRYTADYDKMRSDLNHAFSSVLRKGMRSENLNDDQVRSIINLLQEEFKESFDLLLDVRVRRPVRDGDQGLSLRNLANYDASRVPEELQTTLDKIAFLLKESDSRSGYSIAQDIRALRDIALHNARRNSDNVVLLTFDQKLINIIKIVKYLKEPWSQYISAENCRSLWLWNVADALGLDGSQPVIVQELIDDLRRKGSFILESPILEAEKPLQIFSDETTFLTAYKKINRHTLKEKGDTTALAILASLDELIDNTSMMDESLTKRAALIESIIEEFFVELKRIIPSVNLATVGSEDSRAVLFNGLRKLGVSQERFMVSLDADINEHAKRSFSVLSASTTFAPNTIQALKFFIDSTQNWPGSQKFIHRLPLPIQADVHQIEEVLALVSNADGHMRARYDKLINFRKWNGVIAELTIAYLYASSGLPEKSEKICRQIISSCSDFNKVDKYYFEAVFLLASILRIHRTSLSKLEEAGRRLSDLAARNWEDEGVSYPGIRIESERLAAAVNVYLILTPDKRSDQNQEADREHVAALTAQLFSHRRCILDIQGMSDLLKRKLLANVQVNTMLLCEFANRGESAIKTTPDYKEVLRLMVARVTDKSQRLSFFEEIVTIVAILRNIEMLTIENSEETGLAARLSNRLGWVLQKRERLNDFEYRLCEFAKDELRRIGYR